MRDCLAALGISEGALAAMRGGQVLELNETLREDSELNPITLRHEEGRRIYERCLRMMMLLAVRRLYPGEQVRIEYSAGHGVFVRLPRLSLSEGMVAEIEQEMRRIADAGLPFEKRCWALEDAIAYFEAEGQQDKVELLHYRPFPYFNMYRLGNLWDYFYGAMTPSTAWGAGVSAALPRAGLRAAHARQGGPVQARGLCGYAQAPGRVRPVRRLV